MFAGVLQPHHTPATSWCGCPCTCRRSRLTSHYAWLWVLSRMGPSRCGAYPPLLSSRVGVIHPGYTCPVCFMGCCGISTLARISCLQCNASSSMRACVHLTGALGGGDDCHQPVRNVGSRCVCKDHRCLRADVGRALKRKRCDDVPVRHWLKLKPHMPWIPQYGIWFCIHWIWSYPFVRRLK